MNIRKLPTLSSDATEKIHPMLGRIVSGVQDAFGGIKQHSQHLTQSVISGAKQRPVILLGVALASGFLIGKAIRRKL